MAQSRLLVLLRVEYLDVSSQSILVRFALPSQAQVNDLQNVVLVEHDVGRLQVSVYDLIRN
jgi:5,10-methylene-tetrahydrofolate dehydrogenase/methenyl tetrahydrofolate cyclohydrolase